MTKFGAQGMQSGGNAENSGQLRRVVDLLDIASSLRPATILVAGGDRTADLQLVESARDHGIVERAILIGRRDRLDKAVAMAGFHIPSQDLIALEDDESMAAAAAEQVRTGAVDLVLKGNISTPVLNRHMLPLAERSTVSLATVFDAAPIASGRPIILTDAGVTTVCTYGRMLGLIRNAIELARTSLGIARPRVALLSANEKQVPSLLSTRLAAELTAQPWPDAFVYGPLSFDLATDPASVAVKGVPDHPMVAEVAGRADILVCPGIDSANILYKAIAAMAAYGEASLAGLTLGFPVPYVILSRSDSVETRLLSVALCSIHAQRSAKERTTPRVTSVTNLEEPCILAVNPGSTSLKLAVFAGERLLVEEELPCSLGALTSPTARKDGAAGVVSKAREFLRKQPVPPLRAIAARGGFLPRAECRLPAGVYLIAEARKGEVRVDDSIVEAVLERPSHDHASNLGIPIAAALARDFGVPAYAVDPVVADELAPEAVLSGYAPIERRSVAHVLSTRAAARKAAKTLGRPVEAANFVVAHLGGGITIAAVRGGHIVDNTIALLGGGPFTPKRAGQLPVRDLIHLCYSGRFTEDELIEELTQRGGLQSYLGEHRMEVIEERIAGGDTAAQEAVDAMVYQMGKEIGAMYVALGCNVDAVVLTGGLSRSPLVCGPLRRLASRLAPVLVFKDSLEMAALAAGARAALADEVTPYRYSRLVAGKEQPA